MKKYFTILSIFATLCLAQNAQGKMYECTYKNKYGMETVSSYNTLISNQPNKKELISAYKMGNCKELIVKRYFIEGTICNIQFYKYNKKIGNVTCTPNNPSALKKIKEIARRDYGYFE
ncbi:MAG: hypothetical protein IJB79_01130 [Candidatus Gastranaerophilales bacterium]|nr:hypothetical protein [Candidatus Gastranaerophilales bacterium]